MRSVAVSAFKDQLTKTDVDQVLSELGHGADARTEQLDVKQMQLLCNAFRQKLVKVTGERNPKLANQS